VPGKGQRVDLDGEGADHAALAQPRQPLRRGRRGQADGFGQVLQRRPGVGSQCLQEQAVGVVDHVFSGIGVWPS
jgi:hypothetical protein